MHLLKIINSQIFQLVNFDYFILIIIITKEIDFRYSF